MKPIVTYIPVDGAVIEPGIGACVIPLNHPSNGDPLLCVTNGHPVYTSRVIEVNYETGEFETLNTIYVREATK